MVRSAAAGLVAVDTSSSDRPEDRRAQGGRAWPGVFFYRLCAIISGSEMNERAPWTQRQVENSEDFPRAHAIRLCVCEGQRIMPCPRS